MGAALAGLLLSSQHSLQLVFGAVALPQGALLQPVALLGDSDGGGGRRPPRRVRGATPLPAISTGGRAVLRES